MDNILKKAADIVYNRTEEKTRQYGDFHESMEKAAAICSLLSNKEISTIDMYNAMLALKFSRQSNSHKEDNLLDAIAYMASMNDYIKKNDKNGSIT